MLRPANLAGRPRSFVFRTVTDPTEIARGQEVSEQFRKNSEWLEAHWADLLPGALGKHIAVAGQEAFIADTPQEVIALARVAHPSDNGLLVRYVPVNQGPRIYGIRRQVGAPQ
jgi:hypothetical protein